MTSSGSSLHELATLIVEWRPADTHEGSVARARLLLLDSLGCAIAARGHPAVMRAARAARALAPGNAATGLGSCQRFALSGAILDTGTAIRALDFNDFYWGRGLGGHPSDVFGAALPIAQALDTTLEALHGAVVIGYECYIRLLDLMSANAAFDHTSANGFATAAMASRLRGFDPDRTAHALAMALFAAPSFSALRQGAIAEFKAAAPATMALHGLWAAELAAVGMTGPVDAVSGARGLAAIVTDATDIASLALRDGIGTALLRSSIKRYPCIGTAQAAVAAAVELRSRVTDVRAIERVDMHLADNPVAQHQTTEPYRRPRTRETADHSFYSLVAIALADGTLTANQLAAARYLDADVTELSDRLHFQCDLPGAENGEFAAHVNARLRNGEHVRLEVTHAPGHWRNPLDAGGVRAKFRECVGRELDASRASAIATLCLDASPTTRVTDLIAACCRMP